MSEIEPAAELTPEALEEIQSAILRGYNEASLKQRLRYKWGLRLDDEVNVRQGFKYVVGDLLAYAEEQGKAAELLALAFSGRPDNPFLKNAAARYLARPQAAAEKYAEAPPELPHSLEAVVTARSKLFSYGEFLARVRSLGARLCRIELPGSAGTGWLAGASHVITNFHVVEPVVKGQVPPDQLICRFDYWSEDEAAPPPEGTPVALAADWSPAHSAYSQSDLSGTGEPGAGELDYAVLKLAEAAGEAEAAGGGKRGWFAFDGKAPIVARSDVAMIPQHPNARQLEVAYGRVLEFPGMGMRYRYDVTTEPGTSGSPVLTADLTPFGLHHAAEPSQNPVYNQAVPLWRVARDLEARGVDWAA